MTLSVHIVGSGLIGASLGLALTRRGHAVTLDDISPTGAALARDLGAGALGMPSAPDLVVVATPPDVTGACVERALADYPLAVVTDVASVKGVIIDSLRVAGADLTRFCGSHPMAGRERSGAVSARFDLFDGRAWVITPTAETSERARTLVAEVAQAVGSVVTVLSPHDHDAAVAAVSHVPQVAASLVAARLQDLPDTAVSLAGQGLRDVTRIAASDPQLWTQILSGNALAVLTVLRSLREDLDEILAALDTFSGGADAPGARGTLAKAIAAGNAGQARIPGKHGGGPTAYEMVRVLIPDEPGQLGRLFQEIGDAGVNIEEFTIDHGLGAAFGVADIAVLPASAAPLAKALRDKGWRIHD